MLVVSTGLLLLFVPTTFTVVPGWARWSGWLRLAILVVWLVAAGFVVLSAMHQSTQLDQLMGDVEDQRKIARDAAGLLAIRLAIQARPTELQSYEARLFLLTGDRLMPSVEPNPSDSEGWEIGKGATGYAYSVNDRVVARDATVWDGSYGLTPEQCTRYRHLNVVAAMPVRNARRRPIGVLTLSSTVNDGYLDTQKGFDQHLELAGVLARFLVDLLGRASD